MEHDSFVILPEDGYLVIQLTGELKNEGLRLLETKLPLYISDPCPQVIADVSELKEISPLWLRALLKIRSDLKVYGRPLYLAGLKHTAVQQLKRDGVEQSFVIVPSVKAALSKASGSTGKHKLDTAFVNPFLEATIQVLEVQASTKVSAGKVYLKTDGDRIQSDISGVIGIVSASFTGSVVISFPAPTFLKVVSSMLGETYTEITQDIVDAAGEITNMIFGQAKVKLNDLGHGIQTALPSVVQGDNHSLTTKNSGPTVIVPFDGEAGPFCVAICLAD